MEDYIALKIGGFLWNGFCSPESVGVRLEDILSGAALAGLHLTDEQKKSILAHAKSPVDWTKEDENVRDLIADATDLQDYKKMLKWLAAVVGDQVAAGLIENWKEEA